MEIRDLYDENKELTGKQVEKGEPVPLGYYYITVVAFIENTKGEFLLQKRVEKKDGKWATTGGHPKHGESSLEGIVTEIKEELGIDINKDELALYKTIKTEDDFVDMYHIKKDINISDIVLQEDEVDSVMWASREEIEKLIEGNKFSNSHKQFYIDCLNYLEKK